MLHHAVGISAHYPLLLATWLLPLAGALLLWSTGPRIQAKGAVLGTTVLGAAFVTALLSIPDALRAADGYVGAQQPLVTWLPGMSLGLLLDPLSLLWTLVITGVGFLIHVYSIGYLAGDRAIARFFAYLNFFVFAMLTLVLSDNFLGLLVGWGLVGLASYFLIGFWFEKPSAVAASRKAFVINVAGDVGIMLAIFILFAQLGTLSYGGVFAHVAQLSPSTLLAVCLFLFVGCAAKSAQVPLHTWLPDAMEGPTPVSALIHAATMVTAGVYLIARCHPLWDASPDARAFVGVVGAITALVGAILGLGQWDIKRILAYSTMSQIGYMIMGVGVGAYQAGVLHFFAHAFFKAQLFLGAGIIIHALGDEQDIRRMGGLARKMPFALLAMLTGTLAICGIFPFSGFFSKDAILYGVLEHGHPYLYFIGVLTAAITAYYMFRMLFVVFAGQARTPASVGEHAGHAHHAPAWLMQLPVALLIVPTIGIGWLAIGGEQSPWARFFEPIFGASLQPLARLGMSEATSSLVVTSVVLLGIATAFFVYATPQALRNAPERLQREGQRMPGMLTHAFYFDDALDGLFVQPTRALGRFCAATVERDVLDGGVHDITVGARWLGHFFRSFQTGFVRAYALVLALGVAAFAAYYVLVGVTR